MKMSPLMRHVTIIYLMLLAGVIGAGLFSGAVMAPVIFNSEQFLGIEKLTRFEEGLLMTEGFVRLAYPVTLLCFVVAVFELLKCYWQEVDWLALVSALLMSVTGLMFSFYFVPEILQLQSLGPAVTQSDTFVSIHKTSELSFKVTIFSGLVLAYRNLLRFGRS